MTWEIIQENISQPVVINPTISDRSMICCTRKTRKMKYNRQNKTFCSLKNYSDDVCRDTHERVSFPNNENFYNPYIAYSEQHAVTRTACIINTIAPCNTVRVKNNANEWCDGEIAEKIHKRDYTQNLNKKMHVDEEIYKEANKAFQIFNLK